VAIRLQKGLLSVDITKQVSGFGSIKCGSGRTVLWTTCGTGFVGGIGIESFVYIGVTLHDSYSPCLEWGIEVSWWHI